MSIVSSQYDFEHVFELFGVVSLSLRANLPFDKIHDAISAPEFLLNIILEYWWTNENYRIMYY